MKNRGAAASKSKKMGEQLAGIGGPGPNGNGPNVFDGNGEEHSSPESLQEDGRSPGGVLSHVSGSLDVTTATPDQHSRPNRQRVDVGPNTAILSQERSPDARGPARGVDLADPTVNQERSSRQSNAEGKLNKRKDKSFQLHP